MVNLERKAKFFKHVPVGNETRVLLEVIREKGLEGFQVRKDYEAAVDKKETPLILRLQNEVGCNVQIADTITLVNDEGTPLAVMQVDDKWTGLREIEAEKRFGTADLSNANVKALFDAGDIFFGGRLLFL